MVGKARSSNFTLSEKLDLLKLVKPYVKILEEHTNKHSVIVEKNKCWDIIADNYNAIGVDRPPRTAQGLRTLYKRLKEYAKQELLQQKETHSDCKSSISEPTKKVVEMIPQISNVCLRDRSGAQRWENSFYFVTEWKWWRLLSAVWRSACVRCPKGGVCKGKSQSWEQWQDHIAFVLWPAWWWLSTAFVSQLFQSPFQSLSHSGKWGLRENQREIVAPTSTPPLPLNRQIIQTLAKWWLFSSI